MIRLGDEIVGVFFEIINIDVIFLNLTLLGGGIDGWRLVDEIVGDGEILCGSVKHFFAVGGEIDINSGGGGEVVNKVRKLF